jgi:NADH dehydrogenase [ubiquinone] 1 alpha subcomplex assembly factor 7
MTPLEVELRRLIALDGPMPVARYMGLCLGHPAHGYYVTRDPLGRAGDFVTAPEISQMFGELIGLWAAAVWQAMGQPARVDLVELGPGRGTLMADALRAAKVMPGFRAALAVHLVETSPVLVRHQRAALADIEVSWRHDIAELPQRPAIIVANEFFDALPVHQAVKAADGWHMRMVGLGPGDTLAFMVAPDPLPRFDTFLSAEPGAAPTGAVYEWRAEFKVEELAKRLVRHGGAALIIDYGHTTTAFGATLQAVRAHGFADPLAEPGEADLTAHVDFAALERVGAQAGARVHGPVPQGQFLHRLGIAKRAAQLRANATARQAADINTALGRLTGSGQMGELFKVVAFADPKLGALPGFDS